MLALFASSTAFARSSAAAVQTAQTVCVYNDAAFVLEWRLKNVDTGAESPLITHYPVGQVKCVSATAVSGGVAGTSVAPIVRAILGKEETGTPVLFDPANATSVTFVCKGTTLDFSCVPGPPPPTAADVAKDMGHFFEGFALALGPSLGFADCIADVNATYRAVQATVDFFESGISHKTPSAVLKAFELIGGVLVDVAKAIADCVKDATVLAAKISTAAKALSGNVAAIVKVVVGELLHIFHDRKELTDDCKATAADWKAGDFEGAGRAMGNLTAIIVGGLEAPPQVEAHRRLFSVEAWATGSL